MRNSLLKERVRMIEAVNRLNKEERMGEKLNERVKRER